MIIQKIEHALENWEMQYPNSEKKIFIQITEKEKEIKSYSFVLSTPNQTKFESLSYFQIAGYKLIPSLYDKEIHNRISMLTDLKGKEIPL